MFKSIFDAIKSFFASIFGGSKKKTEPAAPRPTPKPQPTEPENQIPQDGSEIQTDTLVVVANEMDQIIIPPNVTDKEFDDDIFDDQKNLPKRLHLPNLPSQHRPYSRPLPSR